MFWGGGLLGIAVLFLWIYCILDVIATDESAIKHLPKVVWLILVILVPLAGSIAWLVLGRQPGGAFRVGEVSRERPARQPRRPDRPNHPSIGPPRRAAPKGPEDSPEFIATLEERKRLERWEQQLKQREDDLRRREEGEDPAG